MDAVFKLRRLCYHHQIDGYLVPRSNMFRGEEVRPSEERLRWVSGFTGSAGLGIILQDRAALFVDGRYTLQAHQQADISIYDIRSYGWNAVELWLQEYKATLKIAFDPWLYSIHEVSVLRAMGRRLSVEFIPIEENLIDCVWEDKPYILPSSVFFHPLTFSGVSYAEKRSLLADAFHNNNVDAMFITHPESVNWLLNIRGNAVPHTPICYAYALILKNGNTHCFWEYSDVPEEIRNHVGPNVTFHHLHEVAKKLSWVCQKGWKVLIDRCETPSYFLPYLIEDFVVWGKDPCETLKSIKNVIEQQGARRAHERDGLAMIEGLSWIAACMKEKIPLTEVKVASYIDTLRAKQALYHSPSFPTISGFSDHGAVIHYRATEETDVVLTPTSLYLVDSGGQYFDGTTDVTRTITLGLVTDEQKTMYTAVLKGHIALASTPFPEGTTGGQLDALARQYLWNLGVDYAHGTGHGVGSFLSVHEGPQRISRGMKNDTALQAGMIVSNEPGYYKEGEYGIRFENLMLVISLQGGRLGFETLTLVPIDPVLLDISQITPSERVWLLAYHQKIWDKLSSNLSKEAYVWLKKICEDVQKILLT